VLHALFKLTSAGDR